MKTLDELNARDDTERLDWLEKHHALVNVSDRGPHVCIDDGREGHYHVYGGTYREAIDEARREYVPYEPPKQQYPELTEIRFDRNCIFNGVYVAAGTVWRRDPISPAAGDIREEKS